MQEAVATAPKRHAGGDSPTHLVLRASRHLKITVEVGLVVGTMPAMMPMGSATFWMPSCKVERYSVAVQQVSAAVGLGRCLPGTDH